VGTKQIDIVIADDHAAVRDALKKLLKDTNNKKYNFNVVGEAATGDELINLHSKESPDIIITNLVLKIKSGFDVLKILNDTTSKTKVVYYSSYNDVYLIYKSKLMGCAGYFLKNEEDRKIIDSLIKVVDGESVFPDISEDENRLPKEYFYTGFELYEINTLLSEREIEIFKLFGMGFSIIQISESLNICRKSIEYHQKNIKYKLLLGNQYELIKIASRFNLIDQE